MTSADVIEPEAGPDVFLSCPQMVREAGVSYRQMDYWCRVGLVRPVRGASGSGSQRAFGVEQVATVRVVALLVRMGVDHDEIRLTTAMIDEADDLEGMTIEPFPGVRVDLAAVAAERPSPRSQPERMHREPPRRPGPRIGRPRW